MNIFFFISYHQFSGTRLHVWKHLHNVISTCTCLLKVFVTPPELMKFNAEYVEVEVGSELILPLVLHGTFNYSKYFMIEVVSS